MAAKVGLERCMGRDRGRTMGLKTWTALVLGAALTAACSSGSGVGGPEPVRAILSGDVMMLVSFDANGDLSITAEEIETGLAREFGRADTGGDGSLAPIEFQNWSNTVLGGGPMGPYRLDFDRNVDNTITRAEFDTEIRARVSQYDENGDNLLTRGEFTRLVGAARPPVERQRPRVLGQ
jgi:hypothetical protein